MKFIIAGSRTFEDYDLLEDVCDRFFAGRKIYMIASGGAKGADQLGERYAANHQIPVMKFSADWDTYGRSAGPIRNQEMAEWASGLLAFWDGKSRGTWDMIKKAKEKKLYPIIVTII